MKRAQLREIGFPEHLLTGVILDWYGVIDRSGSTRVTDVTITHAGPVPDYCKGWKFDSAEWSPDTTDDQGITVSNWFREEWK